MMKYFFILVAVLFSVNAYAEGREPCSGKKGGVAYCSGASFVCKDGSFSGSKKTCNPNVYGVSGSKKPIDKKKK